MSLSPHSKHSALSPPQVSLSVFSKTAQILPDMALLIPVYFGGREFRRFITSCRILTHIPAHVLVIDSGSTDGSVETAQAAGFEVIRIANETFGHGSTRQMGMEHLSNYPFVVCMTQDTIFAEADALLHLRSAFNLPNIGAVYGRQLPRPDAGAIEAHARLFNYPEISRVQNLASSRFEGIKAAFNSNSFAAYRQTALRTVGGFPEHVILGEDSFVAGKMVLAGLSVAYSAEARVFHSHHYSLRQEFSRYFDIGVFHDQATWLREAFGKAEGEGMRFLSSELRYVSRHAPWRLLESLVRTGIKYLGYSLGQRQAKLSDKWCMRLSMHKNFWRKKLALRPPSPPKQFPFED